MHIIEIDLLPRELKPKKKLVIPQISFLPVLLWAALSLFIIQLILIAVTRYERQQLVKLNVRWTDITSSHTKLAALKDEIKTVAERIATIEGLLNRRFIWSRKLNQLSDAISGGIWLNELHLDIKSQLLPAAAKGAKPKKLLSYSLVLDGTAASREEDETAVIGRFMKSLKEDKQFFADFFDIELGSIQSDKINDKDIMHFTITCNFKEGAIQ